MSRSHTAGFSLVELLVVITIIVVLISLLVDVTTDEVHFRRGASERVSRAPADKDTSRDLRSTLPLSNY